MRIMNRTLLVMVLVLFLMVSVGNAGSIEMTFEGLTDWEKVGNYYNGGYGYDYYTNLPKSGPGPNYGVTFLPDGKVLASVDADAGGTGNFGGEPSESTAIWFQQGGAWMNVPNGFSGSLSFYYSNPNSASRIYIYDGLDKTGNLLATLDLPQTPYHGAPDPTGGLSPFVPASVDFSGIAKSVDFGEEANSAYIDDVVLGIESPTVTMTFEGLTDSEKISNYYNVGYGHDYYTDLPKSGPGPAYGVTFQGMYAAIDSDQGGSGNFGGAPTPKTAIWTQQSGGWMNVPGGFIGRLSFYYSNPNSASKIYIYDGLDKTGNLLATVDLPQTEYNGAPDPTGTLSPLVQTSVNFSGIAKSVDFGEEANSAYIDDITITLNYPLPPEPVKTRVWIGLRNSDDVGSKFDVRAVVLKNNTPIGSGQLDSVSGGSSGFNNARLDTIPLSMASGVDFASGDVLSITLSVRNACSGKTHNSATARLWFNDGRANSRFDVIIDGSPNGFYLRDGFTLSNSAGPGPQKTIDVFVDSQAPCSGTGRPFKPFGTWSYTLP
jgi:hypothetical protein